MEHRGVQIGHVMSWLDGVESKFIGRAMHEPLFHAGPGKPHRETMRVMIAPEGQVHYLPTAPLVRAADTYATYFTRLSPAARREIEDQLMHGKTLEAATGGLGATHVGNRLFSMSYGRSPRDWDTMSPRAQNR